MPNYKKIREIYKTGIAPGYFRQGIPEISGIKNKTLKKYIIEEIKKRRLIEIKKKFGKTQIKTIKKIKFKKIRKTFKKIIPFEKDKKITI